VGKKLTLARADPEDFSLLYPQFATDYSLQIPSKGINREGSFDILYDLRQVAGRDYYRLNPYAAHLYGDNPLTVVRNNRAPNNKKILLVKDSFSLCVAPFLSAGIENLDLLDLRHFDGSIKSYVRENKPDIVIVIYYPRDLQEDGADMFSFR
jgi:hypothetical protein